MITVLILVSRGTRREVVTYFIVVLYVIHKWDWLTLQTVFNSLQTSSMLDFAFSSWGEMNNNQFFAIDLYGPFA